MLVIGDINYDLNKFRDHQPANPREHFLKSMFEQTNLMAWDPEIHGANTDQPPEGN